MSAVEHVVFFPASDGTPAFRRLPSLDEAVSFVEHLRNDRDVREVSVHSLTEVPLNFRTVYRVEVGSDVPAQAEEADAPVAEVPALEPVTEFLPEEPAEPVAEVAAEVAAEHVVEEPVAEVPADAPVAEADVVAAGDGRSLGFFAG